MFEELVARIRADLTRAGDPARAPGMQAYMKSALPFYGVPVPQVRKISRAAARAEPARGLDALVAAAHELFDSATHREERYAALALVALPPARGKLELISLHEYARREPDWVQAFVSDHGQLSPLSRREALKHLSG